MFTKYSLIQVLFATIFAMFAASASAQNEPSNETPIIQEQIVEDIATQVQDEYVPASLKNLSRLYWAIGKLDIDDPKLIDYFLMINECDMFMQYYHNDFEWNKIRQATRSYIMQHMDEFPTRFEIITAIRLGRYDMEGQYFEIEEEDKIRGLRRLDFAMNLEGFKEICTHKGEIYEYPENMIIILNRPVVLEKIPVKPELAKLFIEESKSQYEMMALQTQMHNYERLGYLRLKVRITQYKNTARVVGGDLRAVVFGRLDGYEVYADPEKLKPLLIKNIKDKRFRRLRKDTDEVLMEEEQEITEEESLEELSDVQ